MRPLFNEYKSTDESFIDPIITELWLNFREINLKFSQIISENKKTNDMILIHDI
jgi:trehalose-6-phosphate synthase